MTPRQADLAFLLESAESVLDVYSVDLGQPVAKYFDFVVRVTPGGRALAVVHYALLRLLTHAECTRVFLFADVMPPALAGAALLLALTGAEREDARRRAAARPPREPEPQVVRRPPPEVLIVIVDDDPQVEASVSVVVEAPAHSIAVKTVAAALDVAAKQEPEVVLCAARFAFGLDGLLAQLPLPIASKVLVLTLPSEVVDARWRLQGTERILTKPLEEWLLRNRIARAWTTSQLTAPDPERVIGSPPPNGRLTTPPPSAPFSALVVDLDEEIHEQLRWCFRGEARHVMQRNPEEAAALALSTPFHLVAISANAALHPRSFLDAVARGDRAGADRVLVFAPARDVPYVKHKLTGMHRTNLVLAIPIDDATLRREIFRAHPALAARLAVEEVMQNAQSADDAPPQRSAGPRFRRQAVLVVDDDPSTAIRFAARTARDHDEADVTLVSTPMEAFEHVVERRVDLLMVSAAMRGDSGEPLYRVLWRLAPLLKGRSVLVVQSAAGGSTSSSRHVVERPLTREVVARIVHAFALEEWIQGDL